MLGTLPEGWDRLNCDKCVGGFSGGGCLFSGQSDIDIPLPSAVAAGPEMKPETMSEGRTCCRGLELRRSAPIGQK